MPRTIAIGDVHGCADEFEELLTALELEPEDRAIQLGDLVNRGPDSHRAIELAREYKVESIIGNHELRFLTYKETGNKDLLKDYDPETVGQLTKSDWKYLSNMKKFIFDSQLDTVLVHGGFLPDEPWQTQPLELITSIQVIDSRGQPTKRSDAPDAPSWAMSWGGEPFVVYGHTPRPNVLDLPGSMGIDTGCVYGGHLTAYIIEDQTLVQVRAHKTYIHSKRLPNPV